MLYLLKASLNNNIIASILITIPMEFLTNTIKPATHVLITCI